jgi:transposase-like protein
MRKQHSAAFKANVVVEALREAKTIQQIAAEHQIHPTLVTKWKAEALAGTDRSLRPKCPQRRENALSGEEDRRVVSGDWTSQHAGELARKKIWPRT